MTTNVNPFCPECHHLLKLYEEHLECVNPECVACDVPDSQPPQRLVDMTLNSDAITVTLEHVEPVQPKGVPQLVWTISMPEQPLPGREEAHAKVLAILDLVFDTMAGKKLRSCS